MRVTALSYSAIDAISNARRDPQAFRCECLTQPHAA
jgi:hypothetical protein